MGKAFKKEAKTIMDQLANLSLEDITNYESELNANGQFNLKENVTITKDMVNIKKESKTVHVEKIIPSVIEPSFGIGRIMYSIFEHNFKVREGDEQRTYFSLPPAIAPIKCSVLPLSNNADFNPLVEDISNQLTEADVAHKIDDSSGSIGKRYARTDEVAVPFGITVDFDSLKAPHTVTVRERDSTSQVRMPVEDLAG